MSQFLLLLEGMGIRQSVCVSRRHRQRLKQINYPGSVNSSNFVIDPKGKNVRIDELTSGSVSDSKQFVWAKCNLAESRNSTSNLLSQYFENGQTISCLKHESNQEDARRHIGRSRKILDEYYWKACLYPSGITAFLKAIMFERTLALFVTPPLVRRKNRRVIALSPPTPNFRQLRIKS